jgi:N-acyl homoserine lactone hydrolase
VVQGLGKNKPQRVSVVGSAAADDERREMTMIGWSIHPLDLGTLVGMDKSLFTLRQNHGQAIDTPCLAFVLTGGEKTVLVDTGPCDTKRALAYHRPLVRSSAQELAASLARIGLSPQGIDLVIFTHLHWDHCFSLAALTRARFFVQRQELAYAGDPLPIDRAAYEAGIAGVRPPWMEVRERLLAIDAEEEILPGIRTISLPGHTPGSQGVIVETHDGLWAIAGDAVPLYENWNDGDPARRVPGGIYQNLFDCYTSFERLAPYGARVLPSHDPCVTRRSVYP